MAYTIQTSKQNLFGVANSFYAEAQYTITPNHKDGTFTVKITGVRGYGSVKWNFHQRITTWIASDSAGTGKVIPTNYNDDGYIKIPSSGSNSYTGYMPKSGYKAVEGCEKKFNYKSDGTAPDVYIYLKCYNPAVEKISDGSWRAVNVSTNSNIKSNVTNRNMTKPTFTATQTKTELTKVGLSTTPGTGFTFDRWEVQLCDDGDPKATDYAYNKASLNEEYTVINPTQIVWVRGRNSYNNQWSTWKKLTYDCNKPSIEGATLTATSSNTAQLKFKSNYKCYYKVTSGKLDTGWLGPLNADTELSNCNIQAQSNKLTSYNLSVKRYSNAKLTNSTVITCNTQIPTITISNFKIAGNKASFTATADKTCKDWTVYVNGIKSELNFGQGTTISVTVTLEMNTTNVITVTAKNVSNDLQGTVSKNNINCLGALSICTDTNTFEVGTVYIYNGNKWVPAIPYVYNGTEWTYAVGQK